MGEDLHIAAGWVLDGTGSPAKADVHISLHQGRVVRVDPGNLTPALSPPQQTGNIVDWRACTVLPGLVDAHVHLCWSGTRDMAARRRHRQLTPAQASPVIIGHLRDHLRSGVVAVRDGGDPQGYGAAAKSELTLIAETLPEMRVSGPALYRRGRYGGIIGEAVPDGSALVAALDRFKGPRDHIKLVNSGLNSLTQFNQPTPPQFSVESIRRLAAAAHLRNLPVMVHANGALPVAVALAAGVTSIEHGYFMGRDNLARMADAQKHWVPTGIPMAAFARHGEGPEADVARRTLDHQLEQLALARDLGVPVALGTDAGGWGVPHGTSVASELDLLITAGYTLPEAVQCATANGARLLRTRHGGTIIPGTDTDLIAVPGPPDKLLKSLSNVVGMVVRGRAVNRSSARFLWA